MNVTDTDLILSYRSGDKAARDTLAGRYYNYVCGICVRMAKRMPSHVDKDDLISFGFEGFLKTVDQWNPVCGMSFSSYLGKMVRWSVNSGLSQENGIKTLSRDRRRVKFFSQLSPINKNDRYCFEDEIADESCVSPERKIFIKDVWKFVDTSRSEFDKQIIYAYFMYGINTPQIALKANLSVSAVSMHLRESVAEIKRRIELPKSPRNRTYFPAVNVCFVNDCTKSHCRNGLCEIHASSFERRGRF